MKWDELADCDKPADADAVAPLLRAVLSIARGLGVPEIRAKATREPKNQTKLVIYTGTDLCSTNSRKAGTLNLHADVVFLSRAYHWLAFARDKPKTALNNDSDETEIAAGSGKDN
jgi:hypothetical protein